MPQAIQVQLQRFVKKRPVEQLASIRWWLGYFYSSLLARVLFGVFSWHPRGNQPVYMAFYPESLRRDPSIRDSFKRWIRGNKVNNNGDSARFISLLLNVRKAMEDGIEGDIAELGVWKGNSAALLAQAAKQYGRTLILFDTFEGFDRRDLRGMDSKSPEGQFRDTSIDYVKETIGSEPCVRYIKGFFPESIPNDLRDYRFSVVHIDCDLYDPMKAALEFFYPRMTKRGLLMMHDYHSGAWPGATKAINEFCAATGEALILLPDKSGTALIRKST